jgi:hypothetical protein
MHFELRDKFYKSLGDFGTEEQLRQAADAAERTLILDNLKACLANYSGDEPIDWFDYEIELQKGSSLYEVYVPGSVLLNELLSTVVIRSALTQENMSDDKLIRVTSSGKLEVFDGDVWRDLVALGYFSHSKAARDSMEILADIAKEAGGCLWEDNIVIVDQWLQFYGFDVPKTVAQVRNLIGYFEFDFAEVDQFGNYWGQIITDDPSLIVLSAEQCLAIRNITTRLIPNNQRLLDVLFRETRSAVALHDNAAVLIKQLISHSISQEYAKKYLERLGWFGAETGQVAGAQQLGQVLITAILLDLNPFVGNERGRKSVGSFELYSPSHIGRPSAIVLELLRNHIVTNQWATHDTAPLAIHLWLAQMAPEFLVRQVPTSVLIGSVEWMAFCRGVALVEAVAIGASREMPYAQIMAYAEQEPVSQSLADLHTLTLIDPIIDWALTNGVVTNEELRQSEQEMTQRAITAYQQYMANFSQVTSAYSTPLPDRKAIARAALELAAPTCNFLEQPILFQRPGLYASPTAMSMVDLHMSGDMVKGQWDFRAVFPDNNYPDLLSQSTNYQKPSHYNPTVMSIYTRYPSLLLMEENNVEFHRQLNLYLGEMNKALATGIKLALARLAHWELQCVLNGEVTFFTLRDSAVIMRATPISGPLIREDPVESQEGKDAATGRFGVVMCVSYRGRVSCYEIFTLRGEIHKNHELGQLIVSTGKYNSAAREDFSGDLKTHMPPTPKERLPVNIKCYIEGVANNFQVTSSMAIIDKLAVLPAPVTPSSPKENEYQNFAQPQLARVAQHIVSHHPLMTFNQLVAMATQPTVLELEREQGERNATYIVDLVVPFKKCVQDLSSGEHNRVVDGIYGCAMDAIALVGGLAGAGAKALSIANKASSMSSRLAGLARLVIGTGISIFNPLDDVPSILKGTGKLVYKGGVRLSRQTQEIIALAKSQLSHTKGARGPKELFSAANGAKIGQGTWRPHTGSADALTVLAARKNFYWYALDRTGATWGPKLTSFTFHAPFRISQLHKTLPVSYARHFIKQSLPRAKAKVENAINALNSSNFTKERDFVIKMFLGSNTADARDRLLKYLKLIRTDFDGLSLSNFILDPLKDNGNIAAFNPEIYKQWKALSNVDQSSVSFIEIYTRNMSKHFIRHGYNHDVVADDLIHEMLHGAAQTVDVSYAVDSAGEGATAQVLDVAPLLNLARGKLSMTEAGSVAPYHAASKAFENADSLAVATSLLSQLYSDKSSYDSNMAALETAAASSSNGTIAEPLLVTLNKP